MTRKAAMNRPLALLLALLVLPVAPLASAEGYRVVVHPSSPATDLTKKEISRLFLKKVTTWSDGTRVIPVDQGGASPTHESFSKDIHGRGPDAVAAYWQRQVFSGRAVPPLVLIGDARVVEYVRSTPGAIGYVSSRAPTDGAKVIKVH